MTNQKTRILLFDGDCNLCNGVVQFIIIRDKNAKIKFTSLQSKKGQQILKKFNFPTGDFSSFIYIKNNKAYAKSSAALNVLKDLDYFWKLLYIFIYIPTPLRNFIYNIISKNRYKLFNRATICILPTPELRERFL